MTLPNRLHGKALSSPVLKKTRCPSCHKYVSNFNVVLRRKKITRVCPFCSYEFETFKRRRSQSPETQLEGQNSNEILQTYLERLDNLVKRNAKLKERNAELKEKSTEILLAVSKIKQIQQVLPNEYEVVTAGNTSAPELKTDDSTIVDMMLDKNDNNDAKSYLYFALAIVAHMLFVIFFRTNINYWVIFLIILLAGSLFVNRQLLRYRIRKGYYGANEEETREIIEFILEHTEDMDFTDGDGTKKIMPDPEIELREEFVPVGGLTI